MIALRLHDKGDLRLHEEPVPEPGDDEVLVRVTAVGLCGSDLHWFHEGAIGDVVLTRPLVLGHEFAGVIETGARTGERVALDPAIPCGRCAPCLAGDENLTLRAGSPATRSTALSAHAWRGPNASLIVCPTRFPMQMRRSSSPSASRCTRSTSVECKRA
jgi:threonine dehydrogenase-like Zn-dependent dehydrogenase